MCLTPDTYLIRGVSATKFAVSTSKKIMINYLRNISHRFGPRARRRRRRRKNVAFSRFIAES